MRVMIKVTLILACFVSIAPPLSATKVQVWRPASELQPGLSVVRAPLDLPLIANLGGMLLAEYPTFGLVEVPRARLDRFLREADARGLTVSVREDYDRVRVSGFDFPSAGPLPELPAELSLTDYTGPTGLYLVQLPGPRRAEWGGALVDAGAVVHYYPENTFLVRTSPSAATALRSRPFVQHLSVYQPAYKLGPGVMSLTEAAVLFIQLDTGQDLEPVLRELSPHLSGPPPVRNEHTGPLMSVRVRMDGAQARAFARRPEVIWVEEALEPTLSDERQCLVVGGRHTATQPTNPGTYHQWLESVGFCTSTSPPPGCFEYDTKVAVFDTGIDTNWCHDYRPHDTPGGGGSECTHSEDVIDRHLDLGPRERRFFCPTDAQQVPLCTNSEWGYEFSGEYFHGTAVSSIIAGDPVTGTGARDSGQFYLGSGVAPNADIVTMKLGGLNGFYVPYTENDFADMVAAVRRAGVRFVTNSWNYRGVGSTAYTTISQRFDMLVRDAYYPWNSHNYPMTIVFSAGNYGYPGNPNARVMTPATAKNVITAGSSESYRPPDPLYDCDSATDIRNLASYTTRGVDLDPSRFKPEVVAPSTSIAAARSRQLPPGNDYLGFCGTSAAAPVIAGAAVLADVWYYEHNGLLKPSPAMVKAMLVAHGDDLYGGLDRVPNPPQPIPHRPSLNQGFGRVALDGLFQTTVATTYLDEDHTPSGPRRFVNDAAPWSITLSVANPNKEVLVALAFTDRYSAAGAGILRVNNLDLVVHDGGDHYLGNLFEASGYSLRTPDELMADDDNVVELIRIPPGAIQGGDFTVEVIPYLSMHAVPGLDNGVPNQDFALYVYNGS